MSGPDGKLDVLELARAQLDFAAVNAGAPSTRDVLMKAQTIVPLAPQVRWERVGKGAGAAVLAAAVLALPWVPQQTLFSIAAVQFDAALEPAAAQQLVNKAVLELPGAGQRAVLSATYERQAAGDGLLQVRASAVGERASALQHDLEEVYAGEASSNATVYPVAEYSRGYRRSPVQLALDWARERRGAARQDADRLAEQLTAAAPLLRTELADSLLQHGYQLSAFGWTADDAKLPYETHFAVGAWPRSAAVGIKGYTGLSTFQQHEAQQLTEDWLKRIGLREQGLQVARGEAQPITAEVVSREGDVDPILTARLMARLVQPAPQDLSDINFDPDPALAAAADAALPGLLRRVEFDRVSPLGTPLRFKARIYLLRRADSAASSSAPERRDPVEDSNVREEW